jgi:hypothetical protein
MLSESSARYTIAVADTPAGNAPTRSTAGATVCAACGQRVLSDDDRKRSRFFWGLALAWLPLVAVLVGIATAFRGMAERKATGLGAIAGGASELGLICFVVFAPLYLLSAIVLLLRSFSKAHPARAIAATISICWSILLFGGLALWFWLVFLATWRQ